ncbi:MAG: aldo/keto reductase [Thomasclavelia sp.]
MILNEVYQLNNGVEIPKLGLGTWEIPDDQVDKAVKEAVELGYRHIDTAQGYGNEAGVGKGIRECGIDRNELFVTTKLEADIKDYQGAKQAIQGSLDKLNIGYIDMVIIHAPQPWAEFRSDNHYFQENIAVYQALEEFYQAGLVKAIGLSNFEIIDIENILNNCKVKPAVNQILAHISNTPFEVIEYCQKHDILVEAYSPVAHGEMLKNDAVKQMADKYQVTIPQLCIRYCLQLDTLPLPKTANRDHMANNSDVDFEISDDDMEVLKKIKRIDNYGEFAVFPVYGKI